MLCCSTCSTTPWPSKVVYYIWPDHAEEVQACTIAFAASNFLLPVKSSSCYKKVFSKRSTKFAITRWQAWRTYNTEKLDLQIFFCSKNARHLEVCSFVCCSPPPYRVLKFNIQWRWESLIIDGSIISVIRGHWLVCLVEYQGLTYCQCWCRALLFRRRDQH